MLANLIQIIKGENKMLKKLFYLFIIFGLSVVMIANCEGEVDTSSSESSSDKKAITSVKLDAEAKDVCKAATVTLKATVKATGDADETVNWSTSDKAIATVDSKGVVTGVGAGEATITATSKFDTKISTTAKVTVNVPAITSVTIDNPASDLTLATTTGTVTLTATVVAVCGAAETVTWTSATTTIATVSATGVVTGLAAGTSVITATSTVDTTKTATVTVTVP